MLYSTCLTPVCYAEDLRLGVLFLLLSLQPPLLTPHTYRISTLPTQEVSPILKLPSTLQTSKALGMPITTQRLDHDIRNRLPAASTFAAVPVGMTADAPRIAILLHERRSRIERIAALGAEEMALVPFCAARHDDLALDRRLTRFAARGEELVVVEVAVEAEGLVAVFHFLLNHITRNI